MKINLISKAVNYVGNLKPVAKMGVHSPEIMVGMGIGLMVLSIPMACKATLEADDILAEAEESNAKIEAAIKKNPEVYTEEKQLKDRFTVVTKTGIKMIELYAPAIGLAGLGITSILVGHNMLNKQKLALMGAYRLVSDGYSNYRKNVVNELGEEADKKFRNGIVNKEVDIPVLDKEGEPTGKTKKKKVDVMENELPSEYAKFFDASSRNWTKNPELNMFFLKSQEKIANDILQKRGHLFLNEVYDLLDIPRTEEGTAVGWVLGNGDDYVDFGIFDLYKEGSRRFVNGIEPVILLDFNVDGPIYDKI